MALLDRAEQIATRSGTNAQVPLSSASLYVEIVYFEEST